MNRNGLLNAIISKLTEASNEELNDLVEILYEDELKVNDDVRNIH